MQNIDINSLSAFWNAFKLPIVMSLIGAIIGHYRKNGVIQWPIFSIPYQPGPFLKDASGFGFFCRCVYLPIDFVLYIIGIHIGEKRKAVSFDLGFFGDLLIGVGTGILAKVAIELADVENDFALASASLLAGFAGMSYILNLQKTDESDWEDETEERLEQTEVQSDSDTDPQQQTMRETATSRIDN